MHSKQKSSAVAELIQTSIRDLPENSTRPAERSASYDSLIGVLGVRFCGMGVPTDEGRRKRSTPCRAPPWATGREDYSRGPTPMTPGVRVRPTRPHPSQSGGFIQERIDFRDQGPQRVLPGMG